MSAAEATTAVEIHPISRGDVEAIAEIDGRQRLAFWKERLAPYVEQQHPHPKDPRLCQVAVSGKQVVGFVLADIRKDEFDLPICGWIVSMGIHPAHRGQRVGWELASRVMQYVASQGVSTMRTMVAWDNPELLSFFGSLGFDCGPFMPLEKKLDGESEEG